MGVMCGRFAVTTDPALLAEKIKALDEATGGTSNSNAPNYNVAPTNTVAAVVTRHSEPDDEATRRVRLMRWGLLPPWVKAGPDGAPDTKGPLLINARADKVATSPAFRFGQVQALPGADGRLLRVAPQPRYSGWPEVAKTPFYMFRGDGEPLFAAGLWSVWKPAEDVAPLLSCTIITTDAVGELAEIHDRMPLMLAENDWDAWLNPDAPVDPELLARPPDVHDIELRQVSTLVNSVRNNGPELLAPAEPQPEQITLL